MVGAARRIVLSVRDLDQRPFVGASCCSVSAAAAIEQTLGEWRGVERIEVDEAHGKVAVTLAGEQADGADLLWSLRMLGLDAVENSKRDPIDSDISIHRYD